VGPDSRISAMVIFCSRCTERCSPINRARASRPRLGQNWAGPGKIGLKAEHVENRERQGRVRVGRFDLLLKPRDFTSQDLAGARGAGCGYPHKPWKNQRKIDA
jgi:hypothetical protein